MVESNEEWKCFQCDFAFNGISLIPENVDEDEFQDVEAFDGMLLNISIRYEVSKAQASYLLEAGQLKIKCTNLRKVGSKRPVRRIATFVCYFNYDSAGKKRTHR